MGLWNYYCLFRARTPEREREPERKTPENDVDRESLSEKERERVVIEEVDLSSFERTQMIYRSNVLSFEGDEVRLLYLKSRRTNIHLKYLI